MAKKPHTTLPPITTVEELHTEIDRVGAWFFVEFMEELTDNYDQFRTKELKNQYIDYFYNCCFAGRGTKKELLDKINLAVRIMESGLTEQAVEYALEKQI
jgi:hypothetical protein